MMASRKISTFFIIPLGILSVYHFRASESSLQKLTHIYAPFPSKSLHSDWSLQYAILPNKSHIELYTSLPGGLGQMWYMHGVKSTDLEIMITLRVVAKTSTPSSQGFGIFLLQRSSPPDQESGHFLGFSSKFKGWGVFFANFDRSGKLSPSISGGYNDGNEVWEEGKTLPLSGVYLNYRGVSELYSINIKLQQDTLNVTGKFESQAQWTNLIHQKANYELNDPIFIGLSGASGEAGDQIAADVIEIHEVSVHGYKYETRPQNFDVLNHQYRQIMSDLEYVKQRLRKIEQSTSNVDRLLIYLENMKSGDVKTEIHEFKKSFDRKFDQAIALAIKPQSIPTDQKKKLHDIDKNISMQTKVNVFLFIGFILAVSGVCLYLYRLNRSMQKIHLL